MTLSIRRITTGKLALIALWGGVLTAPALASDWPQWRGPTRNGISQEREISMNWPASGPPILWKARIGKSYSAVTVQNGRAYTMGNDKNRDTVFCFDTATGQKVWTYSYPHTKRESQADPNPTATTATPVIHENRVYTLSREGLALCLDAVTGKMIWQKNVQKDTKSAQPQFGFSGSPMIEGSRIFYNVGKHGLALDKSSGSVLWKSPGTEAGYATPVFYKMGAQKGIAFFNGTGLVGTDIATGKPFWEHKWTTRYNVNATDPIFFDDGFFISAYGRAQRVKVTNGKTTVAYESRNMQHTFVAPIRIGDYLYGNSKGRLACMDIRTGKNTWDQTGMGDGALIAVGDFLIALLGNGELVAVEAIPTKYVEKARAKVLEGSCWVQPTLANGQLYCHNLDGELVCLSLKQ